jgi:S-adenosylmethionine hydrolase
MAQLITLITDFGVADTYVGVLKGVILSINSSCNIVDITHQIPPQDVREACFALNISHSYFPKGTIHLVIVDPGVGSQRRPLVIETQEYFFIGPDNGVFTAILVNPGLKSVIEITNTQYFLTEVSRTFHGRDIFAPVAAHLANGFPLSRFGTPVSDYVLLDWPQPSVMNPGEVWGTIIHIDRFGNLVTNFSRAYTEQITGNPGFRIECAGKVITQIVPSYAHAQPGELCGVFGSNNYLEISVSHGSARDILNARPGDCVKIITADSDRDLFREQ